MKKLVVLAIACATGPVALALAAERVALAQPASEVTADTPAEASGSADENQKARQLYASGEAAFKERKHEEARRYFAQAWSIRRTYDVAIALGQAELALSLPSEAAEHLDFAIRNFPPQLNRDTLEHVKRLFARAEQQVGSILVRADRAGAQVVVDGQVVGSAPLAAPLFLNPGTHAIEARSGDDRVARVVTAKAGVQESLELALGEGGQKTVRTPSPEPIPRKTNVLPLLAGGAVTLAAAGVGLGFALAAGDAHDRADSLQASLPKGACAARSPVASCSAFRSKAEAYDRERKISTVGFAVSAAALAATVGYWILSRPTETPRSVGTAPAAQMNLALSGRAATLSLSGDW